MRRALPCLLLPLLLVACSPTRDQEVTKQVLVRAQTAKDAVSQLTMRYGEILDAAGSLPGSPNGEWEAVAGFRESAEGLATRQFLSEYAKPISVDPTFARAREIEELSRVTAELASLALEPRGTRESFVQEMNGVRSRFDRALSALETGTKSFILVEARTETEEKAVAYSRMLAKARAETADPQKNEGAARTP